MTAGTGEIHDAPPARALDAVVREHVERLAAAGIGSAAHEVRTLARHALGVDDVELVTGTVDVLPRERLVHLEELIEARARRVPLQHLTGETGFRELTVRCRPAVFVPRFETELLVGLAVERVREAVADRAQAVVVEPCTGTGVIALSIAHEVERVRVVATDVSATAVDLARDNLARTEREPGLAPGSCVELHVGDLLGPIPAELGGDVDVVVANPPYLTEAERAAAPIEVRDHDPRAALVGDPGGHAIVDRLVDDGADWLRPGGWLLLEVHEHRAADAAERVRQRGYADVEIVADLTGRDRFVVGRWAEGADR